MTIEQQILSLDFEQIIVIAGHKIWRSSAKKFGIYTPKGNMRHAELDVVVMFLENVGG